MRRRYDPIGQQIEDAFKYVENACFAQDLYGERPGDIYCDSLKKFIHLLVYCGDHHLYAVRDRALKNILRYL